MRIALGRSPDIELVRRMQADDLDAFEAFFARYRTAIYRTAYGLTRRSPGCRGDPPGHVPARLAAPADAAPRRLARCRGSIASRSTCATRAWVGAACRPSRSARATPRSAIAPSSRPSAPSARSCAGSSASGVAALPPKHQSVVVLYYLHGLSLQETAELLDVRLGTVKSRLHYALRSLRVELERDRRFGGAYGPRSPGRGGGGGADERADAACARHRDALLDFVDRRETGPGTDAALDHLDRCRGCEWDLEATALAVAALRRLHREARVVEPPADAWERLRARVERPRAAVWRWRTTLAGLAVGAGLVATIIAPASVWEKRSAYLQEPGAEVAVFDAQRLAEHRAETLVLDQQRQLRNDPVPVAASEAARPRPAPPTPGGPGPMGSASACGRPPALRRRGAHDERRDPAAEEVTASQPRG